MFRVVSANPLLDAIYYGVNNVSSNRLFFEEVIVSAGGFGPNVARALVCLNENVECHLLAGGPSGRLLRKSLNDLGIRTVCHSGQPSRQSAIWVNGRNSRMWVSPSPRISSQSLSRLFSRVRQTLTSEDIVCVGGSVDAASEKAYLDWIRELANVSKLCFCDVRTERWREFLGCDSLILKLPDAYTSKSSPQTKFRLLDEAIQRGAKLVVCSGGTRTLLARTAKSLYRITAPDVSVVNPYGAGDCLMAALVSALSRNKPIGTSLKEAVATATASVMTPVPGHFDVVEARRLSKVVQLKIDLVSRK